MKKTMTTVRVLAVLSCFGAMAGCGKSSSGGGSKPTPDAPIGEEGGTSDNVVVEGKSYSLGVADIAVGDVADAVVWTANLKVFSKGVVDPLEKKLSRLKLDVLKSELAKLQIKSSDTLNLLLSAEKVDGEKYELLATNDSDLAQADESAKSIWNSQCKDIGEARYNFSYGTGSNFKVDADGKSIQISLKICDLKNFLVKPVISVEAQSSLIAHQVVFGCKGTKDNYYVFGIENPKCSVGYRPEAGGKTEENTIPQGFDPKFIFDTGGLKLNNVKGSDAFGFSYNYILDSIPKFAREADACRTIEIVAHDEANPLTEYRNRLTRVSGNSWVSSKPFNTRPSFAATGSVEAFIFCTWFSKTSDSVTSIPVGQ